MKKQQLFSTLILAFLLIINSKTYSQISEGGIPKSFETNTEKFEIDKLELEAPNLSELEKYDNFAEKNGENQRIGISLPVGISTENSGTWTVLTDGSKIWQLEITSKGAKALGLYYDRFSIPEGAKLFVYSGNKKQIIGAFTSKNNPLRQEFSNELILGETTIIEYNEPKNTSEKLELYINNVAYFYRGISNFDKNTNWTEPSESCEVNVNCSPAGDNWQDEKRGIARILLTENGSQYWCSGSLINNTSQDCKPYFLTAYHCSGGASASDHNQWVFYFNYESSSCTSPTSEPTSNSLVGCSVKSTSDINGGTDLQLLELNSTPPDNWNTYYNGWDRSTTAATSGVGIHHPAGSIKKISTYTNSLQTGTYTGALSNAHWKVYWTSNSNGWGVTEGGSSGSPIFNSNGLIVGTLTGGLSSCSEQSSPDYYGKMDKHWTYGNLSQYLDATNTQATSIQGKNTPCSTLPTTCTDLDVFGISTSTPIVYTVNAANGGGYVSGTNGYGDTKKANYFDHSLTPNNYLNSALFYFNTANYSVNSNIIFDVYDGSTGTPGTVLKTVSVPMSTIKNAVVNNDGELSVNFDNVYVPNDFFISFSCGLNMANGDTIAIISTTSGDVAPVAWEEYSGNWSSISSGWSLDIALAIFPKMCSNADEIAKTDDLPEIILFPNPTTGIVNIRGIDNFNNLQIFDMQGKQVVNIDNFTNSVNVNDLINGNYVVKIILPNAVITKKLVLIK